LEEKKTALDSRQPPPEQIQACDLELINQAAGDLNEEIEDILRYQQT
jgi:hypothetical protein